MAVNTILTLVLSFLAVVAIPLLIVIFRAAIRWKGIEDKLDEAIKDLSQIQTATDKRLRWLEENLWNTRRVR